MSMEKPFVEFQVIQVAHKQFQKSYAGGREFIDKMYESVQIREIRKGSKTVCRIYAGRRLHKNHIVFVLLP